MLRLSGPSAALMTIPEFSVLIICETSHLVPPSHSFPTACEPVFFGSAGPREASCSAWPGWTMCGRRCQHRYDRLMGGRTIKFSAGLAGILGPTARCQPLVGLDLVTCHRRLVLAMHRVGEVWSSTKKAVRSDSFPQIPGGCTRKKDVDY